MSVITLDQLAVMSVQYVQYTFDYFLDSMDRCGIHNIDLWAEAPTFAAWTTPGVPLLPAASGSCVGKLRTVE